MNHPALETRQLSIGYREGNAGDLLVSESLSLNLWEGELVCLIGPNGAGKSTLLRTLAHLQKPLAGEIDLLGSPLKKYASNQLAKTLGVVLTTPVQVGAMRARDLVGLGRFPYTGLFGTLNERDETVVERSLKMAGAAALAERLLHELSDGERQKVLIARALAQEPKILLLDEPTAFLDLPGRVSVMQLLRSLAHGHDMAILTSTHDLDQALQNADRLWLMAADGTVREGAPEDLVLSGDIGAVFDQQNVVFDPDSGDFVVNLPHKDEVVLLASGRDGLWTLRALQRAGYRVVFEAAEGKPLIEVDVHQKPTIWRVRHLHKSLESHSIYQLLQNLRGLLNS
ncbi:MAG: ABC transporter ATP-binding protein [Anaerolineaceae bacterium]|jgi:iron complex transport system ATP-binding protein